MDSMSNMGGDIPYKDKYVHFSFYFVFTIFWYMFFTARRGGSFKLALLIFFFAVMYGAAIEICQGLFATGRSADILDVAANTAGSATAVVLLRLLFRNKNNPVSPP
jgi:VanZ family protein